MAEPRVLFAASEAFPFAKTGGLADVAFSLPRTLKETFEIDVVLPLYRSIDRERFEIVPCNEDFNVDLGADTFRVELHTCYYEGLSFYFVDAPLLGDRDFFYGPPDAGYEDNDLRFGLFCHAIVWMAERFGYEIVHLNDWQTALAALLIAQDETLMSRSVFTIHNLAYQGTFPVSSMLRLAIDRRLFTPEGVEFYGQLNLMKAGIAYADAVTTVSPNYACEILTPEYGFGLEGFLQVHRRKLSGIVNGIDTTLFAPASDTALATTFETPAGKRLNKLHFLHEIGIDNAQAPLFIFIGRFTAQKGIDLLIDLLEEIVRRPCLVAILGEGERAYHERLLEAAEGKKNIHIRFGYDESLSHRMYAAADFLLMPSLFEPCGLNQLIAMHYGALPLAHNVGGLADTVHPSPACLDEQNRGCGILFDVPSKEAFVAAFEQALSLYANEKTFERIGAHNMAVDVSWDQSAQRYADLYRSVSDGRVE